MNEKEKEEYTNVVRELRNKYLQESDWTQIPDVPLPNKQEWLDYRQALRDLPKNINFDDLYSFFFPTPPNK